MTIPSLPGESRPAPIRRRRSVSLFWPIALIGIGIAFLLNNMGRLVNDPLMLLAQYWPVLLIAAGIELIFERTGWLGTLVSVLVGLAVAGGALYILMTPGLVTQTPGLVIFSANNPLRAERVARPLDGARAAKVDFDLRTGAGSLQASKDSPNLIEAEASLRGELINDMQRSGDTATVRLGTRAQPFPLFFFEWAMGERWDIQINPSVALDLNLNVRSGALTGDLSGLALREVRLDQDSGQSTLVLPESGQYRLNLQVNSGSAEIKLPRGLPARVRYRVNSGALNTALNRASGNNREGTYETPGFSQSGSYVMIDLQLNSGSVTFR
jgi:hypothetical protein